MKKIVSMLTVLLLVISSINAQTTLTNIKVSGNCGMCKGHIEKAAKAAGATTANWDKVSKILKISFDAGKTSTDKIEDAIAQVGYDTEHKTANADAYGKLDECCQYERKGTKEGSPKKPN